MSLYKRGINYSFASGLDTKTDQKLLTPGKLSVLENSVFKKTGTLNKRFGEDQLSNLTLDQSNIESCLGLAKLQNQLCLFSKQYLYSYISATDRWLKVGNIPTAVVKNTQIVNNSGAQSSGDLATNQGVTVIGWLDVTGGITSAQIVVTNQQDSSILVPITTLKTNATGIKLISLGYYIFVFVTAGTKVYGYRISATNPSIPNEVQLFTDLHATTHKIDVTTYSARILFTYVDSVGNITLSYITQNLEVGSPLLGLPASIDITGTVKDSLSIFLSSDDVINVIWNQSSGGLMYIRKNLDFTANQATVTIDALATAINHVTVKDLQSGNLRFYYDITSSPASNTYINTTTVTGGVAGTTTTFIRSVGLASKGFMYDNNFYLSTAHSSNLQSTFFVVREDGVIVSKSLYQLGGGLPGGNTLSDTISIDDNTFLIYHSRIGRLETSGSTVKTRTGVSVSQIDFTGNLLGIQSCELGKQLHIAGGIPIVYDGGVAVESGFHLYPEGITASNSSTGGYLTNGTRQYAVVYEWIDHRGDFYRSAPSIPLSVTLSGGTSTQKSAITYPNLRITSKSNVTISIYRTVDGGSIFYRTTSVDTPIANDPTSNTGTFNDTLADSTIQSNEILYTTGGILENIAPPPCSIITTYNNRLFMAGSEDKNQVHYTKPYSQQTGVEYNDTFIFQTEKQGGDITSLFTLDDKLIIFKETSMYMIKGNGPTNAGLNNDLLIPQRIVSDVGCSKTSPNSVIDTPLGLMFKSNKGIYLLDRGLSTKYIGAPVEQFNNSDIVSSVLQGDASEVRFYTNTGDVLIYNYYYDQWSTFSGLDQLVGAISVDNTAYWVDTLGQTYRQATHYNSAGKPIKQKIVTGWFAFNQPQGFQRIYEIALLGKFKSNHKLRIKLYYDYKESVRETFTIDADTLFNSQPLGNEVLLGDNETLGGADLTAYQFKIKPKKQKCQGIKISIEDMFPVDIGEGFELSNIHFVVGIKPQASFVSETSNNEIKGDD